MVAVLSTFPAEGAAVVERATVTGTTVVNGRTFRFGTLGGAHVIMGLTGIGPVNAGATTSELLDRFPVSGVIVSAVAGSSVQVGDVRVPARWELADGTSYPVDAHALIVARRIAQSGVADLEQCTTAVGYEDHGQVCFPNPPAIRVGGVGMTSDPFHGTADPCTPNATSLAWLLGCDVTDAGIAADQPTGAEVEGAGHAGLQPAADASPVVEDEETAAIAAEADKRGIPFIAFRGVSDGAPDPLNLPGFPAQFYAYYPISANNAAAATVAFLERFAPR
jgi:nucleoside phosphorylase